MRYDIILPTGRAGYTTVGLLGSINTPVGFAAIVVHEATSKAIDMLSVVFGDIVAAVSE